MENFTHALRIVAEDLAIDIYAMARLEKDLPHTVDAVSRTATITGRANHWDNANRTRRVILRIIGPDTPARDAIAAHFFDLAKEIAGLMHTLDPHNDNYDTDHLVRLRDRAATAHAQREDTDE